MSTAEKSPTANRFVSVTVVADALGLSGETVRQMCAVNDLPAFRRTIIRKDKTHGRGPWRIASRVLLPGFQFPNQNSHAALTVPNEIAASAVENGSQLDINADAVGADAVGQADYCDHVDGLESDESIAEFVNENGSPPSEFVDLDDPAAAADVDLPPSDSGDIATAAAAAGLKLLQEPDSDFDDDDDPDPADPPTDQPATQPSWKPRPKSERPFAQ